MCRATPVTTTGGVTRRNRFTTRFGRKMTSAVVAAVRQQEAAAVGTAFGVTTETAGAGMGGAAVAVIRSATATAAGCPTRAPVAATRGHVATTRAATPQQTALSASNHSPPAHAPAGK
jgi:hypothetical protein